MKYKAIAIVTLVVCGAAAWKDITAEAVPIEDLLDAPVSFPSGSVGGVQQMPLRSASLPQICQPGRINVFVFYSENWEGSRKFRKHIDQFAQLRPDVAFQMIDLGPQWRKRDCTEDYGIQLARIPHLVIYAADGRLLAADNHTEKSAFELLADWGKRESQAQPSPHPQARSHRPRPST